MNALLALIARLAEAGLLSDDIAADLTTRLEAVEAVDATEIEGVNTTDDADRAAAEVEAIASLGNADPALLTDVRSALVEVAQNDDTSTNDVVAIAEHIAGVMYVEGVQGEIAQHDQEVREAALAGLTSEPVEPEPEVVPEPVAEAEPVVEAEPVAEPVMASAARTRPRAGDIGRRTPAAQVPVPTALTASETWRLKSDAGTHRMGEEVSRDSFIEAFTEKLNDLGGNAAGADQFVRLGSRKVEYPEARVLDRDPVENGRKVKEALDAVRAECLAASTPEAAVARVVTAAGGICAPVEPQYDYITVGDADRPVKDFYSSFQASRGGISWRTAPTIASLGAVNTTASGVSIWTAANDASPSDPTTKPVFTATCPSVVSAQIYAVVARLRHGNFMGMYDPETVALWVHLQEVLQARIAETQLLTDVAANSIQVQEADIDTGFSRDWLNGINRFVTNLRYLNRMPDNEPLDFAAPQWARQALRDDRVLEIPGAPSSGFTMSDEEIDSWFARRGLRVLWFRDTQYFATQPGSTSVSGALAKYPTRVKAFISGVGHHVVLDGGSLDIGVERSTALNDTNDTQTMSEVMEKLVTRGPIAYSLDMNVCVSGTSSGTATVACTS